MNVYTCIKYISTVINDKITVFLQRDNIGDLVLQFKNSKFHK